MAAGQKVMALAAVLVLGACAAAQPDLGAGATCRVRNTTCVKATNTDYAFQMGAGLLQSIYTLTPERCAVACALQGFTVGAVGGANYCMCDSQPRGTPQPESSCTRKCPGNTTLPCGGASGQLTQFSFECSSNTYRATAWRACGGEPTGCFVDDVTAQLEPFANMPTATPASCAYMCYNLGYAVAGVSMGPIPGNTICSCGRRGTATAGKPAAASSCSAPCSGNKTATCGGVGFVMKVPASCPWWVAGAPRACSIAEPVCTDGYQNGARPLIYNAAMTRNNSHEFCAFYCNALGYARAGVDANSACHCDVSTSVMGTVVDNSRCTGAPCPGNTSESCGGPNTGGLLQYSFACTQVLSRCVDNRCVPAGAAPGLPAAVCSATCGPSDE